MCTHSGIDMVYTRDSKHCFNKMYYTLGGMVVVGVCISAFSLRPIQ